MRLRIIKAFLAAQISSTNLFHSQEKKIENYHLEDSKEDQTSENDVSWQIDNFEKLFSNLVSSI